MKYKLYQIANHIAGAKNALPAEWQDWAEEIESDLRRLAAYSVTEVEFTQKEKRIAEEVKNAGLKW